MIFLFVVAHFYQSTSADNATTTMAPVTNAVPLVGTLCSLNNSNGAKGVQRTKCFCAPDNSCSSALYADMSGLQSEVSGQIFHADEYAYLQTPTGNFSLPPDINDADIKCIDYYGYGMCVKGVCGR